MGESLIELRKKPHTSMSAVREYLACPRRYFLKYERKAQPAFRPAALALGIAWHEAVARWLGDEDRSEVAANLREDLHRRLREDQVPVLFDDDDEDEEHFVARALEMFDVFTSEVAKPRRVLGTEISFALDLSHPLTGEVLAVPVIGAIDAVVIDDHGVPALWELKTAKRKWSGDQAEFDTQVTLYRRAARELGYGALDLRILVTTKTKEPAEQLLELKRTNADEDELASVFFGAHRAIAAGADHPTRGWQCRSCPYAGVCR